MKNKFKPVLLLILALALVFTLAACGAGSVDQDSINMDEQAAETQSADTESADQTDQAVSEEEAEDSGSGGIPGAYAGPRTKIGKMFAGWFAQLFEWLYLATDKIGFPSWILTIFLFTLIVRGLMQPLMGKQMRSSRKMQLLKPELDEIKRRYASNPQKMNEATSALYKENDCSPTAGCLPLLIQMPILIWLFAAIRTYNPLESSYPDIVNSAFNFMWIDNLAEPDPTGWVLPLLVAVATFAQQWITTADRTDRTQRMMMFMMPLMFFFFSRSFPALMCFYWIFYSLISTAIMWPFMRKWEKEDKAKIEEKRRAKEEDAERRRQKKAAAREAYQKKKAAKPKKPAYAVEEGDLVEEEEEEEPDWDEDEEFEFDPEQEMEENFLRYLKSNHIKVKEKKMKLHPYSTEAELVKMAYDEKGKELDYDGMLREFTKQYQKLKEGQQAREAVASTRLGKLFGMDKRSDAVAAAAAAAAKEAVDDAIDDGDDGADETGDVLDRAKDKAEDLLDKVEDAFDKLEDKVEDVFDRDDDDHDDDDDDDDHDDDESGEEQD